MQGEADLRGGDNFAHSNLHRRRQVLNTPFLNSCICSDISSSSQPVASVLMPAFCGSWGRCYLALLEHESRRWVEERVQPLCARGMKERALPQASSAGANPGCLCASS